MSGRNCDGCTLCCKLMRVGDKPAMQWCQHCVIGTGCGIYETRPSECRTFHCGYLQKPGLSEDWRPSVSKMVIALPPGEQRIVIFVDPSRRGRWRRAPYYPMIKHWAQMLCPKAGQVLIHDGAEVIAVLPDREKSFGPHREGRTLTSIVTPGPNGPICDVIEDELATEAA